MNMEQETQSPQSCGTCHGMLGGKHGALTVVCIILSVFLLALTIKTIKEIAYVGGGIAPTNAISVSGTGEVVAVPDVAEFTFSVIEEGATATEVRDNGTKKMDAAIAALEGKGVEKHDIKTIAYELQPRYEYESVQCIGYPCEGNRSQKGFTLTQSVQVKVRKLDTVGEVLEVVTNMGVQGVSGLTFTVADRDTVQAEARKEAINKARAKGEALAAELGVSLVRVVGFNEDGGYPVPLYAEAAFPGMGGDMVAKSTPVVPAGESKVTSQVMITYEIR